MHCRLLCICHASGLQVCKANPGLEVRLDAGEGKGKGVFATKVRPCARE